MAVGEITKKPSHGPLGSRGRKTPVKIAQPIKTRVVAKKIVAIKPVRSSSAGGVSLTGKMLKDIRTRGEALSADIASLLQRLS